MYTKSQRGFTLVELVVTAGIVAVIGVSVAAFQRDIFSYSFSTRQSLDAQYDANKVVRTMVTEIRSMSESSAGAYPIANAATSSLTFYTDFDGDSEKEKIRYFLQNGTLKRGVIQPSASLPATYNGTEQISEMVHYVRNATTSPIFRYYDGEYDPLQEMSYPLNNTNIRHIKIEVIIDEDVNRLPGPMTAASQVTIRNLREFI